MLTRRAVLAGAAGLVATGAWADGPVNPGIRPRSAWGAVAPKPGGKPHTPTTFTLHHTAGPVVGSSRAPATLKGIQTFHMGEKGWIDIAYHVFVDADGVAWEGRDPGIVGDTATTYDPTGYFLVCALGNFEEAVPSAAQVEGLARVLAMVHAARGISLDTLRVHKDLAATLCPGKNLAPLAPAIRARAAEIQPETITPSR